MQLPLALDCQSRKKVRLPPAQICLPPKLTMLDVKDRDGEAHSWFSSSHSWLHSHLCHSCACPWLDTGQATVTQTRMTTITVDQLRVALTLDQLRLL